MDSTGLGYPWVLTGGKARYLFPPFDSPAHSCQGEIKYTEGFHSLRPLRDLVMMRMIDAITDKSKWMEKICDATIRQKWQEEFLVARHLTNVAAISEGMIKRVGEFWNPAFPWTFKTVL